jgi:hypothetical protein
MPACSGAYFEEKGLPRIGLPRFLRLPQGGTRLEYRESDRSARTTIDGRLDNVLGRKAPAKQPST